jgi:RNA polymerase sigma-70 factor (ECF subfamily)
MDRDLVERAQRGDREAFAILARSRSDGLFAIAHRILRDIDRSEDAVQQTLVIAWRELPMLRDPDRFEAWLQAHSRQCLLSRGTPGAPVERQHPAAPDGRAGRAGRHTCGR